MSRPTLSSDSGSRRCGTTRAAALACGALLGGCPTEPAEPDDPCAAPAELEGGQGAIDVVAVWDTGNPLDAPSVGTRAEIWSTYDANSRSYRVDGDDFVELGSCLRVVLAAEYYWITAFVYTDDVDTPDTGSWRCDGEVTATVERGQVVDATIPVDCYGTWWGE